MLKILGDINFADWYFDNGMGVGTAIANGADPFLKLNMNPDDFWIGNFECVCADVSISNHPFVISPVILSKISHMSLYGVANNHVMQAGDDAYLQTLSFLKRQSILYAGSDNQRSVEFSHQDKHIGFMAFSMRPDNFTDNPLYWHLPKLAEIQSEIHKLSDCDLRIVYAHWGYEFVNHPNIEQRQMAHWLIDSGADIVVGMHPHVAQGAEIYKGKHIFYSLGNSVFNMAWEPTKYGLMINIDLAGEKPKVWSDYIHIGNDFFPEKVTDVPKAYSRNFLDSRVANIVENEKYFIESRNRTAEYTQCNRKEILNRMLRMPMKAKCELVSDFVKRRLLSK